MKIPSIKTLVIVVVAVAAFGAGIWFGIAGPGKTALPIVQDTVITVLPKAKPLETFSLKTGAGKPFNLERLKGKYSLIFFGYTSCPDVCPTTMYELKKLYGLIKQDKLQMDYQVIFVSVDPRRDTPERLQKYVVAFDKDFIGATGEPGEIHRLARQLGASYDVEEGSEGKGYSVSHTDLVFVVDPEARFAAILTPPHQASRIETRLSLLRQVEKQGGNN